MFSGRRKSRKRAPRRRAARHVQREEYREGRKADFPLSRDAAVRVDDPRGLGHERHAVERQPQQEPRQRDAAELRGGSHANEAVANSSTARDAPAGFQAIAEREELPDRHRRQHREADEQRRDPEAPLRDRADECD